MATRESTFQQNPILETIQTGYDDYIRDHLPRKIGVFNGIPARGDRLLDATDHHPDYETGIIEGLRSHVQPGDDVVVVGGGFGVSTVVAANQTGMTGSVLTFEASREHYDLVQDTIALNDVDDTAHVEHAVLGEAVSTYGPLEGAQVIPPEHLPTCDVLELDCEGAELGILEGLEFRPRVVIVESHGELGAPTDDVKAKLDTLGFEVQRIVPEVEEEDVMVITATCDRTNSDRIFQRESTRTHR